MCLCRFHLLLWEEIMTDEHIFETTSSAPQPYGVHLVGSVPLANAEEVFRTTSSILGGRLRRIPDGETGVRSNWIGWQAIPCSR